MKKEEDALALAKEMVDIGNMAGRRTVAVISDMEQPLGFAVGNALEVKEAIAELRGEGPDDFHELCLTLGSRMLMAGGKASDEDTARAMLEQVISDGTALKKFAEFVDAQGGNGDAVYNPDTLPKASIVRAVCSKQKGYVNHIACDEIGVCSLMLGGGRETKESVIDLSVGLILNKKAGDFVEEGEPLAYIHANDEGRYAAAAERFLNAYVISDVRPNMEGKGIIKNIISGN